MVTFIKETQYRSLMRKKGIKRMFKTSRTRLQSDLRAYAVLVDLMAKFVAGAQGCKIVQPAHVRMAQVAIGEFSK